MALDQEVVRVERMQLVGDGTALDLTGEIRLRMDEVELQVTGDANLGILQGFIGDIRSSGNAELVAEVRGSIETPVLTGFAAVTDGRIRHFSLPHSLETVSGRILVDADRHSPRRPHGVARWRTGAIRWPDRLRRVPAR